MIDLVLYRYRIGVFCGKGHVGKDNNNATSPVGITGNFSVNIKFLSLSKMLLISVLYLYFVLCMLGTIVGMLLECKFKSFPLTRFRQISDMQLITTHLIQYLVNSMKKSYTKEYIVI